MLFKKMKTLSITLYNRPDYTKTLLNHLNVCYNIDDYNIFIYCEPNNKDVLQLAQNFRQQQARVIINPNKFGCNKNIYQALDHGLSINDFHIHLEDDTIPSKDFLVYCEWCRDFYKNRKEVFSVSGYVNSKNTIDQFIEKNTFYNCVKTRNWFTPWGWATWKDRWLLVKDFMVPFLNISGISWDVVLHRLVKSKLECFPMVSRIQNIGAENGTYCPGPIWHSQNQYNEYWIETSKQYQTNFIESI